MGSFSETNVCLETRLRMSQGSFSRRRQMMLRRDTFVGCFARVVTMGRLTSVLLLSFAGLFGLAVTSHAQAISTADKGGQIDAFGTFTFTSTDFEQAKDVGGTVGGTFLLRKLIFGQPAFSARYMRVTSSKADESFIGGGLESHYRIGPVRPYGMVLYGVGGLSQSQYHYSDSGNTLLIGGGVDVPINRRFAARGEFTYSFVNITGYQNTSVGELNLKPVSVSVGLVYHIK
jgi:hypothetical protein